MNDAMKAADGDFVMFILNNTCRYWEVEEKKSQPFQLYFVEVVIKWNQDQLWYSTPLHIELKENYWSTFWYKNDESIRKENSTFIFILEILIITY